MDLLLNSKEPLMHDQSVALVQETRLTTGAYQGQTDGLTIYPNAINGYSSSWKSNGANR